MQESRDTRSGCDGHGVEKAYMGDYRGETVSERGQIGDGSSGAAASRVSSPWQVLGTLSRRVTGPRREAGTRTEVEDAKTAEGTRRAVSVAGDVIPPRRQ